MHVYIDDSQFCLLSYSLVSKEINQRKCFQIDEKLGEKKSFKDDNSYSG